MYTLKNKHRSIFHNNMTMTYNIHNIIFRSNIFIVIDVFYMFLFFLSKRTYKFFGIYRIEYIGLVYIQFKTFLHNPYNIWEFRREEDFIFVFFSSYYWKLKRNIKFIVGWIFIIYECSVYLFLEILSCFPGICNWHFLKFRCKFNVFKSGKWFKWCE